MKRVDGDASAQYSVISAAAVIKGLKSHIMGLTNPEAARRFNRQGANAVDYAGRLDAGTYLRERWPELTIAALATGLALYTYTMVAAIAGAIILATLLGPLRARMQRQARANAYALLPERTRVIRNDRTVTLETEHLAVGDLVRLQNGDIVPADMRLVEAADLFIDHALLFGDRGPAHMYTHPLDSVVPPQVRHSIAFAGTTVVSGEGVGIVIATGGQTELGRAMQAMPQAGEPSPVEKTIRHILYGGATATLAVAVLYMGVARIQGAPPDSMMANLLALCIAGVGCLLPLNVWSLRRFTQQRLRRQGAGMRQIAAIEQLAQADILLYNPATFAAADATAARFRIGRASYTLEQAGTMIRSADGKRITRHELDKLALFFEAAAMSRQPTLVRLAQSAGFDTKQISTRHPLLRTLAYDAHRHRSGTLCAYGEQRVVFVQGTLQAVLAASSKLWDHGHVRALSEQDRQTYTEHHVGSQADGHHTIALAYRILPKRIATETLSAEEAEQSLTFLGAVDVAPDTLASAQQLLAAVHKSNVHVSLLSDQPHAYAITDSQLAAWSNDQLVARLERGTATFAQTSSNNLVRIIRAAQARGHHVTYVGHALYDRPAMAAADVAIAAVTAQPPIRDMAHLTLEAPAQPAPVLRITRQAHRALTQILEPGLAGYFAMLLLVSAGLAGTVFYQLPMLFNASQLVAIMLVLAPASMAGALAHQATGATDKSAALPQAMLRSLALAGVVAAAYTGYFWLHSLSPVSISSTSVIALHAGTLAAAVFVLCQILTQITGGTSTVSALARAAVGQVLSLAVLAGAVYLPPAQSWFMTYPLSSSDWLIALAAVILYAGLLAFQRTNRRHSRRTIIELRHKVSEATSLARE